MRRKVRHRGNAFSLSLVCSPQLRFYFAYNKFTLIAGINVNLVTVKLTVLQINKETHLDEIKNHTIQPSSPRTPVRTHFLSPRSNTPLCFVQLL